MKITSVSNTTKAAIRKRTSASSSVLYQIGTSQYIYKKEDKETKDNDDSCLVSEKGLRFHKIELTDLPDVPVDDEPDQDEPAPTAKTVDLYEKSIPDGAVKANALHPDFSSQPLTKTGTQLNGGAKGSPIVQSKTVSRDHEVTVAAFEKAIVMLRLSGNRGIYMDFKPKGHLRVGITTSANAYEGGQDVLFGADANRYTDEKGWFYDEEQWKPYANIQKLTIGVKGFEIYIKGDGELIWSAWNMDVVQEGSVAFFGLADPQYNIIYEFTATFFADVPLKSDTKNRVFDVRDYELFPDMAAKGSIDKGSNRLRVKKKAGLFGRVGDPVILPIGNGKPHTLGNGTVVPSGYQGNPLDVGGSWPAASANGWEAIKELPLKPGQTAWNHYDGEVFQKQENGDVWGKRHYYPINGTKLSYNAYQDTVLSKAHRANIVEIIDGKDEQIWVLDRPAKGDMMDGDVFYDSTWTWNAILFDRGSFHFHDFRRNNQGRFNQADFNENGRRHVGSSIWDNGWTVNVPPGKYYLSDNILSKGCEGLKLQTSGTVSFVAAKGCPNANIWLEYIDGLKMTGAWEFVGNGVQYGRGLDYWTNSYSGFQHGLPDDNGWPHDKGGGFILGNCTNFHVDTIKARNTYTGFFGISQSNNGVVDWVDYYHEEGVSSYDAWGMAFTSGTHHCVIRKMTGYSKTTFKLAQTYDAGAGCAIEHLETTNCIFSNNGGTSNITLGKPGAGYGECGWIKHEENSLSIWINQKEDTMFFGSNSYKGKFPDGGGVYGIDFICEGYINGHYGGKAIMPCINVHTGANVQLENLRFNGNVIAGPHEPSFSAIRGGAPNTMIKGVRVNAPSPEWGHPNVAPINIKTGSLKDVKAGAVSLGSGVLSDVEAEVLFRGADVKVETGCKIEKEIPLV